MENKIPAAKKNNKTKQKVPLDPLISLVPDVLMNISLGKFKVKVKLANLVTLANMFLYIFVIFPLILTAKLYYM